MKIRYLPSADSLGEIRLHRPARELRERYGFDMRTFPVAKVTGAGTLDERTEYDLSAGFEEVDGGDIVIVQNAMALGVSAGETGMLIDELERLHPFDRGRFDPDKVAGHLATRKVDMLLDLRKRGVRVVVDIDDDYSSIPFWNLASTANPPWTRRELFRLARGADMVTTTTPALATVYGRLNRNVRVLPNALDWRMWRAKTPRDPDGRVRIGWYGSFKHRSGDLAVLRSLLPQLCQRFPQVDVMIGGPGKDEAFDYLEVPEDRRVHKNTRLFNELPELLDFDIGLIPLIDCSFNEGKSHLKGMEMNASHIPFVASSTQPYRNFVRTQGDNGFLARRPNDFLRYVSKLVEDRDLRWKMGQRGRVLVQQQHTLRTKVEYWRCAYEELVDEMAVAA